MSKPALLATTAVRSLFAATFALTLAGPAWAQPDPTVPPDSPAEPAATATDEAQEPASATPSAEGTSDSDIVVTGSRIRRPNLESPLPVTSVAGEEFFQNGVVSVGDVLNDLPAIRNTYTTANSTRFLGTTGLNLLDLRGLGTVRTLVLVNGRRHVPGDGSSAVDINTIPADLIERVDVVTGGNSAVYGSDAIAGVINFILKQDYEGVTVRGQGGVSTYGDLGNGYVSVLGGTNFSDGRGNIALNVEVARQDPAFFGERKHSAQANGFVPEDTDPSGTPNGSDGIPDNVFYENISFPFFENGGGFYSCCQPFEGGIIGVPYIFLPDGTLVPKTGTIVGRPNSFFNERYLDGNGSNAREGKLLALSPQNDRFSVNLVGHFTVSDAFEPFVEAKYVRQKTQHQPSGPAFFGFGTATGSPREIWHSENPFLTDQAKNVIADYYGIPPEDRDQDFLFNMTSGGTDLGVRNDNLTRDTYRIVGGARGNFNDDWNYEVALNYGVAKQKNVIEGNLNLQRFLLAIDAVRDLVSGNIVCRAQIDPSAALPLEKAATDPLALSTLPGDVAACVPANFFGQGNLSPAARDYLLQDTTSKQKYDQFDLSAFVSGDTSEFLNLPGGPIGFSVGAEYRKETLESHQDPLVLANLTFYNVIGNLEDLPAFEVKELSGELRLPILKDLPFAQELTVSGAGRVADYKGKTGTVYAWNLSGEWAPIRDIRFRANAAKAVRAPNLTERFFPLSQSFNFLNDPCSLDFIGTGTANREANCRAAGIPANYNFNRGPTYQFLQGGNPDLEAETSKSYTFGGVFQPSFIPGLSVTADYYNITVDNVITAPTAQAIFNACYDLPSLDNPFCGMFQRAGATPGPQLEPPFSLLLGSLRAVAQNYAKLKVRGIDVEAAYRHQLSNIGRLDTKFTYTHVFQNNSFLDPTNPGFADQILVELGDPQDQFNWNVNLTSGRFEFGYQMRYISKMLTTAFEDWYSKQGRDPQNADINDIKWYPKAFYHDVRFAINATNRFNLYMGIENLTNKKPPLDVSGTGGFSGIYDNRGRMYYAGAVAKF